MPGSPPELWFMSVAQVGGQGARGGDKRACLLIASGSVPRGSEPVPCRLQARRTTRACLLSASLPAPGEKN